MSLISATETVLDKSLVLGYSRIGPAVRRRWWPADPRPDALAGRRVVVTGGSSGLGTAAASGIARLGATVHLVGRKLDRLEQAAESIRSDVPDAELVCDECDVSDLEAARSYGERLVAEHDTLHAVVHDAGVMPPERTESAQGHELALATHVLGPVVLTETVRPLLAAADGSRVVVVTSGGMYSAPLDDTIAGDMEYERGPYAGIRAYARTKRLQVLLTERLAHRYRGDDVAVHAMHPGWADTPGVTDSMPRFAKVVGPILRTAEDGADTVVWLTATDEATPTGSLWCDRRTRPTSYLPWQHDHADAAARAWAYIGDATSLA